MKKILLLTALFTGCSPISAQSWVERPVMAFRHIHVSGTANVYYTDTDGVKLSVSAIEKDADRIKTFVEKETLFIDMKGGNENDAIIYIYNNNISSISVNGESTFKTMNQLREDSVSFEASGTAQINAGVTAGKVNVNGTGAGNLHLNGNCDQLNVLEGGAANLKAFDLVAKIVYVKTAGASTAKVNASDKIIAIASGVSTVKIKGSAKDVSAESTSASSITRIMNSHETVKGNKDSTTIHWKGKKVIIIAGDKPRKNPFNRDVSFDHWAGFSFGVNGLLTPEGNTRMKQPYEYMNLNYSRSINFQLNFFQRNFHLYKDYVNLITGFGLEWRRYMLHNKTTLNPDSSFTWGKIDSTNTFNYHKNLFKSTLIQVPLLLEFNTSKKANHAFHMAIGAVGQFLVNSKTKQIRERNGDDYTKIRKDGFNMVPWNLKAHGSIGYSNFTAFGEYNFTSLFTAGRGPQLYPFVVGVRLVPF